MLLVVTCMSIVVLLLLHTYLPDYRLHAHCKIPGSSFTRFTLPFQPLAWCWCCLISVSVAVDFYCLDYAPGEITPVNTCEVPLVDITLCLSAALLSLPMSTVWLCAFLCFRRWGSRRR
eukprot:scpid110647/ scgid3061/ 